MSIVDEARWLFAQIAQIHSTDHGAPLERCMELARQGYALTASCDTHPKDGDVKQAPLVSGAVPEGQTPNHDPSNPQGRR